MKALLDAGADVSLAAEGGVTPLHAAAELGGLELVNLLLKVLPFGHAALCFLCTLDVCLSPSLTWLAFCFGVRLSKQLTFACLSS